MAILVGCTIACVVYGVFCPLCVWIMDYIEVLHVSCETACEIAEWC